MALMHTRRPLQYSCKAWAPAASIVESMHLSTAMHRSRSFSEGQRIPRRDRRWPIACTFAAGDFMSSPNTSQSAWRKNCSTVGHFCCGRAGPPRPLAVKAEVVASPSAPRSLVVWSGLHGDPALSITSVIGAARWIGIVPTDLITSSTATHCCSMKAGVGAWPALTCAWMKAHRA